MELATKERRASACARLEDWHVVAQEPDMRTRRLGLESLSPRERQTLELTSQGLRSHEIGVRLGIAEGTVKSHLRNLYRKLGVNNRVEATAYYLRQAE
jgi:DNA-binding CsgD family transcriptional regulator